jgi:N6-L-threonylcarbamoyladenine synthase
MDVLAAKCARALEDREAASLVVVGGVSASPQLRDRTAEVCAAAGVDLALPSLKWSTDNGAMIALAGWDYFGMGLAPHLKPATRLSIEQF